MLHQSLLLLHLQFCFLFIAPLHILFQFSFHFTTQRQFSQCSINLQCFTNTYCSFCSNCVICFMFSFHFNPFHSFLFSATQIQFSQCSINLQYFSDHSRSFCSSFVICYCFSISLSFLFLFITTKIQFSQ